MLFCSVLFPIPIVLFLLGRNIAWTYVATAEWLSPALVGVAVVSGTVLVVASGIVSVRPNVRELLPTAKPPKRLAACLALVALSTGGSVAMGMGQKWFEQACQVATPAAVELYSNADLARSTGHMIQVMLLDSRDGESPAVRAQISTIAHRARESWPEMGRDGSADVPLVRGVTEHELLEFIENRSQPALTAPAWEVLLDRWADDSGAGRLPAATRRRLAQRLSETFGTALREMLKRAFEHDKPTFAAACVDISGELLRRTAYIETEVTDLKQAVEELIGSSQWLDARLAELRREQGYYAKTIVERIAGLQSDLSAKVSEIQEELRIIREAQAQTQAEQARQNRHIQVQLEGIRTRQDRSYAEQTVAEIGDRALRGEKFWRMRREADARFLAGDLRGALWYYEQARAINPQSVLTLYRLALCWADDSRGAPSVVSLEEAEMHLEAALRVLSRQAWLATPEMVNALCELADTRMKLGRRDDGVRAYDAAMRVIPIVWRSPCDEGFDAADEIADAYYRCREESRELQARTVSVSIARDLWAAPNATLSFQLHDLAIAYWNGNQIDLAIATMQEAVDMRRGLNLSARLSSSLSELGVFRAGNGNFRIATACHNESIEIADAIFPTDHALSAKVHRDYAATLLRRNRTKEAMLEAERSVQAARWLGGADIVPLLRSLVLYGEILEVSGQEEPAEAALREVVATTPSSQDIDARHIRARTMNRLGEVLLDRGDVEGSLALVSAGRSEFDRIVPAEHCDQREGRLLLALVRLAQHQHEVVVELLDESLMLICANGFVSIDERRMGRELLSKLLASPYAQQAIRVVEQHLDAMESQEGASEPVMRELRRWVRRDEAPPAPTE